MVTVRTVRVVGLAAAAVSLASVVLSLYAAIAVNRAYVALAPLWGLIAYAALRLSEVHS